MIREQNFRNKNENYDENKLVEIETVDTVEDFWMVYQHMRRPTAMPYGTFLHVFKDGIRPVWEDKSLERGCQLEIKAQKQQTSKYWEDLLLAMLGEQFCKQDFIGGLVLKLKPQFDKIGIWLTNDATPEAIASIKSELARLVQVK